MDVGVDLNAKYAVRQFLTTGRNHDIRVFSNTVAYNSDNYEPRDDDRPFNICNHSSLFKFLRNFARMSLHILQFLIKFYNYEYTSLKEGYKIILLKVNTIKTHNICIGLNSM